MTGGLAIHAAVDVKVMRLTRARRIASRTFQVTIVFCSRSLPRCCRPSRHVGIGGEMKDVVASFQVNVETVGSNRSTSRKLKQDAERALEEAVVARRQVVEPDTSCCASSSDQRGCCR